MRDSDSLHREGENMQAVWSPDTKLIAILVSDSIGFALNQLFAVSVYFFGDEYFVIQSQICIFICLHSHIFLNYMHIYAFFFYTFTHIYVLFCVYFICMYETLTSSDF